jgi:hypothetical protein
MQLSTVRVWYEQHHGQRVALLAANALGACLLALAPQQAGAVMAELGTEIVTQPTYGLMVVVCVIYAFAMAAARRWQSAIYERLLYGVVIVGVMIVGLSAFARAVYFPIPASAPLAVAWWTLRIVAYHFTVAAFPIIVWQFGQEQYELREAEALRGRAK